MHPVSVQSSSACGLTHSVPPLSTQLSLTPIRILSTNLAQEVAQCILYQLKNLTVEPPKTLKRHKEYCKTYTAVLSFQSTHHFTKLNMYQLNGQFSKHSECRTVMVLTISYFIVHSIFKKLFILKLIINLWTNKQEVGNQKRKPYL